MKSFLLISLAATSLLSAQTGDPRIRDSDVDQRLQKARAQMLKKASEAKTEPAKGSNASFVKPHPPIPGIFESSDILCFNGNATLVPKRAILHQPQAVASRVNQYQPGSKLLSWLDFYAQNRGWITMVEVSRAQAQGKAPLDEEAVGRFRKGSNLVVATFQGGPISVNPPKESTPGAATKSVAP